MSDPEFARFLEAYPSYASTKSIDDLRARDYARLDKIPVGGRGGQVYLDYTGGGIYAESQIRKHQRLLRDNIYGNPHSSNPTSQAASAIVESARAYVLQYFNASPQEYDVVFTANASAALKLVGESYPFGPGGSYLLTFDNHNSVNGIREFAYARGAQVTYIPVALPDMRVVESQLAQAWDAAAGQNNLFAYPAQSNFSAVQHPLTWIKRAQARGWDVLLDAAAFAPSNRLDLSLWKADFVALSFYKIFGYPTGLGALIARRQALAKLRRPWFAGGTITVASVQGDKYYLADGHAAFEDGSLDYLNIPAIEIGLKHVEAVGIETIHERVRCLTGWLLDNLTTMKHTTGAPLVRIYGPMTTEKRGGALSMNFFNTQGQAIDHRAIEDEANKSNISLRTGCFCNPGAGELALEISRMELAVCFAQPQNQQRLSIDDFRTCIDGKSTGAVRVSVGLVTNFDDAQRFVAFAQGLLR